jgi:uncharacterized RDD family membrane protein YckC
MQTYGQFSVFPLIDKLPIWRDRDQLEPIAVAGRSQKLQVVRREGELYCIRLLGIGYGYVRADDVISERDARTAGSRQPTHSGADAARSPYPNDAFPGDAYTGFAPVGFIERLISYLIDFIILFAIYYAVAVFLDVQRPGFHTEPMVVNGVEGKRYEFTFWAGGGLGIFVSFVAGLTYWIGSWSAFAATPGKMLLGQQIVHANTGEPIGIGACVLRYVGTIISSIPLCLGYLWIIWDAEKQGWHDKIANTRVVRTR